MSKFRNWWHDNDMWLWCMMGLIAVFLLYVIAGCHLHFHVGERIYNQKEPIRDTTITLPAMED